ncbi:MAG TPA: hypothetical protein VN040_20450 [Pseudosphingobacterium sp.]|nr:hypothetical protein [Pseudosphingobacterium sp.]
MKNLNNTNNYEVYTELSISEVFDSICEKEGYDDRGTLTICYDCIRVERNLSIFESLRGLGAVYFKLRTTGTGTTISCTIEPFSESFIKNWLLALLIFLIVFACYVFYLAGPQLVSSILVIGSWLLTLTILYNGIHYHKSELEAYSKRTLACLNIVCQQTSAA